MDDLWFQLYAARLLAAFLAGGALSVSGAVVQALFKNPLASPSVLGITSGAHLFGELSLVIGYGLWNIAYPHFTLWGALLGALLSFLVFIPLLQRSLSSTTLVLTGFVLSTIYLSISGLLHAFLESTFTLSRALFSFSMGSLASTTGEQVQMVFPLILISVIALLHFSHFLDVLSGTEAEARSLGVPVKQTFLWSTFWISILVGSAVSLGGNITFVGLVIPHLVRPLSKALHIRLLPLSFLVGGIYLVLADQLVIMLSSHIQIPLSVITGILGAPVFLHILQKQTREDVL